MGYVVELRNSDGELVTVLEKAFKLNLTRRINEPDMISFSIPASESKSSHLLLTNEIWIVDADTATVLAKGIMYIKEDVRV